MRNSILEQLRESRDLKARMLESAPLVDAIEAAAGRVAASLKAGGKLLLAGNGGSAADAQHIAAEFVGRFQTDRQGLPAIALNANTSVLTAIGNDFGFERVFSRQVAVLCSAADVFIGLSTSGRSPNILGALQAARARGARVIGLTGEDASEFSKRCDVVVSIPSSSTPRIQEAHILVGHAICSAVERELASNPGG